MQPTHWKHSSSDFSWNIRSSALVALISRCYCPIKPCLRLHIEIISLCALQMSSICVLLGWTHMNIFFPFFSFLSLLYFPVIVHSNHCWVFPCRGATSFAEVGQAVLPLRGWGNRSFWFPVFKIAQGSLISMKQVLLLMLERVVLFGKISNSGEGALIGFVHQNSWAMWKWTQNLKAALTNLAVVMGEETLRLLLDCSMTYLVL